jgi:hypothetical protein
VAQPRPSLWWWALWIRVYVVPKVRQVGRRVNRCARILFVCRLEGGEVDAVRVVLACERMTIFRPDLRATSEGSTVSIKDPCGCEGGDRSSHYIRHRPVRTNHPRIRVRSDDGVTQLVQGSDLYRTPIPDSQMYCSSWEGETCVKPT